MAVQVFIKRRVKQRDHAKKLVPLILQMRALALHQPGYITGRSLCELEHPGNILVISTWETVDDWNRWQHVKERAKIENKIEAITGEKTQYSIYAPMVAR